MKAFLHIGLEKTGTTTIQHFLAQNRNILLKNSILYPFSPGWTNQEKLTAFAIKANSASEIQKSLYAMNIPSHIQSPDKLFQFRNQFKKELAKELKKSQAEKVIFSNEHCSSRLFFEEEINSLKELLQEFFDEIKIIIYLRRQDEFITSSHSTGVKYGGKTEPFSIPSEELIRKRYDYWNILKRWEPIFGKENIIVKLFERSQMVGGDLLQDFAEIVGIEITEEYLLPTQLNRALDIHCLEFLRILNKHFPIDQENYFISNRGKLVTLLEQYSSKDHLIMEEEMQKSFMLNFEESNQKVANYFLNRADGKLFTENFKKGNSNYSQNLTLEKAFEIFAYLWKQEQIELIKLNNALKKQKSPIEKLRENLRRIAKRFRSL